MCVTLGAHSEITLRWRKVSNFSCWIIYCGRFIFYLSSHKNLSIIKNSNLVTILYLKFKILLEKLNTKYFRNGNSYTLNDNNLYYSLFKKTQITPGKVFEIIVFDLYMQTFCKSVIQIFKSKVLVEGKIIDSAGKVFAICLE